MRTMLFVHGTGVREKGYATSLRALINGCKERPLVFADIQVQRCFWGSACGAKLPLTPRSIPDYEGKGAVPTADEREVARWLTLFCDPLFELREVVHQYGEWKPSVTSRTPPCEGLNGRIAALAPSPSLAELAGYHGLGDAWDFSVGALAGDAQLSGLLRQISLSPEQLTPIMARCLVIRTLARAEEYDNVIVDGGVRDHLVDLTIAWLGGRIAGLIDVFVKPALALAGLIVSPVVRWRTRVRRTDLTDIAMPITGDILAYQGRRGHDFRRFIRDEIEAAPTDDVIVVAHSLGGIAAIEMLIEAPIPKVTHLVTAGSQAPFFYEMDTLNTLAYGQPLPIHFPKKWLNVYDPHDILAYRASDVFPDSDHVQIEDLEIDSRQPFPQSHGSYWTNQRFWHGLTDFLRVP